MSFLYILPKLNYPASPSPPYITQTNLLFFQITPNLPKIKQGWIWPKTKEEEKYKSTAFDAHDI